MRLISIIFCLTLTQLGLSQRGIMPTLGAKSLSLGGISTTLEGPDALLNNFAMLSESDNLSAILTSDQRFNLSELTSAALGVHIPIEKIGHFGLTVSSYGFEDYKEQKLSLAYARKLNKFVSISGNFDLNNLRITDNGSTSFVSFGLGLQGMITDDLRYGLMIFTPEKIAIVGDTQVPSFLLFGVSNQFSNKLEKLIDEQINFKTGIDLKLLPVFNLRVGYSTAPGQFSFGLSYIFNKILEIDGAVSYNTLLGLTSGISIKYSKK